MTSDRDLKWRQYELLIGFARQGLELALKASLFYFAVTGAMLSFYASRPDPTKLALRLSLLLPLVMGLCFMAVSAVHAGTAWKARAEVKRLAEELAFSSWPDPGAFGTWMRVSVILYGLISVGLSVLIFCPTLIARLGY